MQKILVSGAGGFVGARVMHLWRGQAELTIFPRGFLAAATEEEVIRFAAQVQPDVILHLAALSDTGYCQQHPEESRRANVELPCWMAKAARAAGAKLVAFSSDQVYAGVTQDGPLAETLPLSPANVYGQHKLEAEQRALELLPDAVLLRAAQDGTPVQFSRNDWRGVSFVREVIENLRSALALPGGVYNFGSGNDANMAETAKQFAERMGITVKLKPADWHRDLLMDGSKAAAQGIRFRSTLDGFAECLKYYHA